MSVIGVPTYVELCQDIGVLFGWNEDNVATPIGWATETRKLARVNGYVKAGMRKFYYETGGYVWSFLRPVVSFVVWPTQTAAATDILSLTHAAGSTTIVMKSTWTGSFYPSMVGKTAAFAANYTITGYTSATTIVVLGDAHAETVGFTIAADGDYRLPDTFGGISGDVTYGAGENMRPILSTSNFNVRSLRASGLEGPPSKYAILPIDSTGVTAQTYDMQLYPLPDEVYTLYFQTHVRPTELSTSNLYPLGSAIHARAITEACLSEAEKAMLDGPGQHATDYERALASAIRADAKMFGHRNLGSSEERELDSDQSLVIFDG